MLISFFAYEHFFLIYLLVKFKNNVCDHLTFKRIK